MPTASKISTPTGLVGVTPREPIGVAVAVGIRGKSGAPIMTDRFWFATPVSHSAKFGNRTAEMRDPHPGFVAWNEAAGAIRTRTAGGSIGRFATLRGNLVHSRMADATLNKRGAQKLPEPHPNPPSRRPACEGDGIRAVRYMGLVDGLEQYDEIPCPNEECIFAMSGLCKAKMHLLFRLRWDPSDPFEANFLPLLAKWESRSIYSLRNLLGLFEHVLGTERVAPWVSRELWKPGLAADLGVENPSLIGMPFEMHVGEKTKPADAKSPQGRRFPVISFSPDGDLVAWLLAQARQKRELSAGPERAALPPAAVTDPDFLEVRRHADIRTIDPAADEFDPIAEVADSGLDGAPVDTGEREGEALPVDPGLVERDDDDAPGELGGEVLLPAPTAAGSAVEVAPFLPLGPPWQTISAREAEALALRLKALGREPVELLEAAEVDPAMVSDLPHLPTEKLRKVCSLLEAWERAGKGRA